MVSTIVISNSTESATTAEYNASQVKEICAMQETTTDILRLPVCASRTKKEFSRILTITLIVCIVFVMFTMGCKVQLRELWKRLQFPYGILIGFCCQFGIMPMCAFLIATLFSLPRAHALVVLIMGCLPGGNASNLLCYCIAMTALSTVLAFAMVPLCLLLYARGWVRNTINIPFVKISMVLASFIAPVALGIAINFWKPKVAEKISKVGATFGVIILIAAGVMGIVMYPEAWHIPTSFWIVSGILPAAGYVFGYGISYLLAKITKVSQLGGRQIRTISIETGMQNTQMCTAIIQLNYTCTCLILEMYAYPLVYFMYQVMEAMVFVALFQVYKKIVKVRAVDERESNIRTHSYRIHSYDIARQHALPMATFENFRPVAKRIGVVTSSVNQEASGEENTHRNVALEPSSRNKSESESHKSDRNQNLVVDIQEFVPGMNTLEQQTRF